MNCDLGDVCRVIIENGFTIVTLQFPDHLLSVCVAIHEQLTEMIADPRISLFLATDSTFGSSVDDVSAAHIDSHLLVYFGDDLSSSSNIPVIVAPDRKDLAISDCVNKFMLDTSSPSECILVSEAGFHHHLEDVRLMLEERHVCAHPAHLPPCADLKNWTPSRCQRAPLTQSENEETLIGGLFVKTSAILNDQVQIWYIGDKDEQINNICLKFSDRTIVCYSPTTREVIKQRGSDMKCFKERFGAMSRVEQAGVVGLIIGSMGLAADATQALTRRLQHLIDAAGKKYYTFVVGRLNEAKLCNFPEVDIYCLVSNEDTALISPRWVHPYSPFTPPFTFPLCDA